MSRLVKILSIDGGGIRGLIPALLLARLEHLTRTPVCRLFDLIAGTSTGGILALGLTVSDGRGCPRYGAEQLAGMYENRGAEIFSRSIWHRLAAWNNLKREKYPCKGLDRVLGDYFGNARLSEALTDVLVTGYEIERRFPFFFRSSRARQRIDYDFPICQVARATSAAPTYFQPMKIPTGTNSNHYTLIDGGVFANNPAACALVEARTTHPEADGYLIVSLGTGELLRSLPYDSARSWGLAQWAKPILDVVFDGVSSTVDYQLRKILAGEPGAPERYFRFQTTLDGTNHKLDNAGVENLTALQGLAQGMIERNTSELARLCEQLTK